MSFTPSQTRLLRALAAANAAYLADMRAKTHGKLMRAAAACVPFASLRDGVVVYAETKRVIISERCQSPRWGDEPTGELVEWHAADSPSRWQPSSPGYEPSGWQLTVAQWDPPTSPARSPPSTIARQESPRGDRSPTEPCYTPTAPDTETETLARPVAPKRARDASPTSPCSPRRSARLVR